MRQFQCMGGCAALIVAACAMGQSARGPGGVSNAHTAPASEGERDVAIPANGADSCLNAAPISGYWQWAFNLAGATTDGLVHPQCAGSGSSQIWRDRWWAWTAPASGVMRVETCGLTSSDTRIAVYAPASPCPPTPDYVVGCNDDACSVQSSLEFVAQAGQTYLVRVGLFGAVEPAASGSGLVQISSNAGVGACPAGDGPEQFTDLDGLAYSSDAFYRVADDYTLGATGTIDGLCWWGSYFNTAPGADAFTVTYWTSVGGRPGLPIASFSQVGGLAVERAATEFLDAAGSTMFRFSARHAPVPAAKGVRYWVEVRNVYGGTWYWQVSTSGNGAMQDPTPPSGWNDAVPTPDMSWRLNVRSGCANDTNGDGQVNFADLNNIISSFNSACP